MGKRQRENHASEYEIVIEQTPEQPFLGNFAGSRPPRNLGLTSYKRVATGSSLDKQVILKGETDKLEFYGDSNSKLALPARYAVGVVDHATGKIRLAEASVIQMTQTIKALKSALTDSQLEQRVSNLDRKNLGETFGTRKALTAIRSYERGQIDMSTLAAVQDQIQSTIDDKAQHLETPEQIEEMLDASRPIPPFDANTEVVEQVYKLEDLITPEEMDVIPLDDLMSLKRQDVAELKTTKRYPEFVMDRLQTAIVQKDVARVKKLVYLSFLIKFKLMRDATLNCAETRAKRMGYVPKIVENRLMDLFTELYTDPKDGTQQRKSTSFLKDKLASYICALCLHIDNFACNPTALSRDLKITPTKTMDLFKQLGCQVETSKIEGMSAKRARLYAPVKFPKPPRGRRA